MILSVRKKIWLGTGFLFLLLIITGGVSLYQVAGLKNESRKVLQDNYETLLYCHLMQQQLDSLQTGREPVLSLFEQNLQLQEGNITEAGEVELTRALRTGFERIKAGDRSAAAQAFARQALQGIITLNMQAIRHKNDLVEKTTGTTLTIIEVLVGVVLLAAFTFLLNFPSVIAGPIRELEEAIKEIGNKNYRHRIHSDRKDEFGHVTAAFNQMAQRLEYFEHSNLNQLLFEKSRAEAVINSLKDASIGIDKSDKILFANYQALELLGLKTTAVVGKQARAVAEKNELFDFLLNSAASAPFKIVVDGRENYFMREVIEVEQEGLANSRVIVLKNITSFKELDVAKTNFIATISHELKTPLAASDFSLRLLEDERTGNLSDEQKELIAQLKDDNRRMLKILSELLNMSQVEAGRIQIKTAPVSPVLIVEQAEKTVAVSIRERKLTVVHDIETDLPVVQLDAEKTTWVINNLLSNAIKYSEEGGLITVSVYRKEGQIVFSVADHGPGIPKEYQHRLFDRYYQVPGTARQGTGLGLAISKEFIEAQGGRIWVESKVGEGTLFGFSLPL